MKHLFVINPIAGGKKHNPQETKKSIEIIAQEMGIDYEIYTTTGPLDATKKVSEEADKQDELRVYACGGDGTLNECCNGTAGKANTSVTHFPTGTGNDFIKTFGKENVDKFRDLRALINGQIRKLDLIDCGGGRYGINICSVGIDARVGRDVHKYSKLPIVGGAAGYVVALISNVIRGVSQKYHVSGCGIERDEHITLMCACNGRFYGGGFNPVPDAIPDDGILEILIIDAVSRIKVAAVVGKYSKGRYRELSGIVTHLRGDSMEVGAEKEFVVQIDGEIIHRKKLLIKLIPQGINFVFPEGI